MWRAVAASGLDLTIRFDERLRERDFGAFDGMTREGIRADFPDEARRRESLGPLVLDGSAPVIDRPTTLIQP